MKITSAKEIWDVVAEIIKQKFINIVDDLFITKDKEEESFAELNGDIAITKPNKITEIL